jgi:putative transposase
MCEVLEVSPSGFYSWVGRPKSLRAMEDEILEAKIRESFEQSRRTYGAPRVHADLRLDHGLCVGRKRVARIMRTCGLVSLHQRKKWRTTIRDEQAAPSPDLVDRHFQAFAPDELWVADIKYIPTWQGHLYLAHVVDVCTRAVVGWSMREDLSTQLVLDALEFARWRRGDVAGVVHHSDHGCQYTSYAFSRGCKEAGIVPSMGSVGDCFDNALSESFNATIEKELVRWNTYRTRADARRSIFDYIEAFYNPKRRHSSLGQLSPAEFERRFRLRVEGVSVA